jgi:hypothetical protein
MVLTDISCFIMVLTDISCFIMVLTEQSANVLPDYKKKKMAAHLYISFVITMIGFCSLFDGVVFFLKSKLMPCACHYKGKLWL